MNNTEKNEIRAPYKIVIEGGEGEIVEKKSRFIKIFITSWQPVALQMVWQLH